MESAGVIAPPPVLYLGALLTGFIAQLAYPLPLVTATPTVWAVGALFLITGGAIARWAFVTMRRIGTSASPLAQSSALVTDGPFRLSRNPIYLAMTSLYLGITLLVNSGWPLMILPPLLAVMRWGVIAREERYLTRQFGRIYLEYKTVTRRWL